jgi:hypothetical protein
VYVTGLARCALLTIVLVLSGPARLAVAAATDAGGPESSDDEVGPMAFAGPMVSSTVLVGLAFPSCDGQPDSCKGSLGPAPSIEGLVLYEPTETWAFGLVGQLARLHWEGTYVGMTDGATHAVDSELLSGFAGLAARFVMLPRWSVTPVFELALGSAFQTQTGSNFGCNDGVIPTGQIAAGGRARVTSSLSLFAMASASGGIKGGCGASDGPPATPFVGWGFGFHAGAAFDIMLGGAKSGAAIAAR